MSEYIHNQVINTKYSQQYQTKVHFYTLSKNIKMYL